MSSTRACASTSAACSRRDGWAFSLIYVVTFGGFIGLASFLPTYFYDQFKVTKVEAGQLTMLATLMGSAVRVVGARCRTASAASPR